MATFKNPTLADLRARVRVFIDEPLAANFRDTDINQAINEAQQDVAIALAKAGENYFVNPVPTTITMTGARFYTLPDDFAAMIFLYDQNTGSPIDFVSANIEFGVSGLNQNQNLIPNLSPAFYYVPQLPDLTNDADTSVIPRRFVDLVALQAAMDMMIKDEAGVDAINLRYSRKLASLTAGAERADTLPRKVTRLSNTALRGIGVKAIIMGNSIGFSATVSNRGLGF